VLYVRVSLMRPRAGQDETVARIMDELVRFYAKQPGYVTGYKIRSADELNQLGRITIWRSEHDAAAAAGTTHVMAKRSALNEIIEPDSHAERSYHAEAESNVLTRLLQRLKR
jgi:heme-degrading monooxygenase HmoA